MLLVYDGTLCYNRTPSLWGEHYANTVLKGTRETLQSEPMRMKVFTDSLGEKKKIFGVGGWEWHSGSECREWWATPTLRNHSEYTAQNSAVQNSVGRRAGQTRDGNQRGDIPRPPGGRGMILVWAQFIQKELLIFKTQQIFKLLATRELRGLGFHSRASNIYWWLHFFFSLLKAP